MTLPQDPLRIAEAILAEAQAQAPRAEVEQLLQSVLQKAFPYSLSATEIGKQLGLPQAPKVLAYLALFGEVEKIARGRYRAVPPQA